ncbi:MAG: O-antigen ligase family protein [Candidatus Azambacteria bacterium]|nr:O-antigen ligase family protein [Candidatus Azambacteria bacterium]
MSDNTLVTIIKWLTGAALCVPLVFSVYFYPSHVAPQTFLFRLIVEAMLFVYFLLVLRNSAYAPKLSPMLWAVAVFIGAQALAGVFGLDPMRSFFSDFDRHWGFITIIHFFIFFVIVSAVVREDRAWRWLLAVSVGASFLTAGYGVYQFFFEDIGRIYSTIGNAGFFATYLLLNAAIALWLALGAFFARPWRLALGGIAMVNVVVAMLTSTRAAMLALAAGIMVMGCGYIFWYEHKTKRIKMLLVALFITFVLVGGAVLGLAHTSLGVKVGISRLAIFSFSDVTTRTRLFSWEAGWKGFLDAPLLGVGPENFKVVFNKYFDPGFYTYEIGETEFDRAHNILIEQLATAGGIGVLAYISMFMMFLYLLWKGRREGAFGAHTSIILGAFVVMYGMQGFFNMDTLTSFLPLFLVFGYVTARITHTREDQPHVPQATQEPLTVSFAVTALTVFLALAYVGWAVNIRPALADRALSDADDLRQRIGEVEPHGVLVAATDIYERALGISTYGKGTVQKSLAVYAFNFYQTFGRQSPQEFTDDFLPFAMRELDAYIRQHPHDYLAYSELGRLYNIQLLLGIENDERVEGVLAQAQELAPERLEVPLVLAQRALIEGDYTGAAERAEEGIAKSKKFYDFYRVAFIAYSLVENEDKAFYALDEGVQNGLPLVSEKEMGWLAQQYEKRGMQEEAQVWYARAAQVAQQ